jgi:hypothetical protein
MERVHSKGNYVKRSLYFKIIIFLLHSFPLKQSLGTQKEEISYFQIENTVTENWSF